MLLVTTSNRETQANLQLLGALTGRLTEAEPCLGLITFYLTSWTGCIQLAGVHKAQMTAVSAAAVYNAQFFFYTGAHAE